MSLEPFATSRALTLGVELELQIVNTHNYDLAPHAQDLMRLMKNRKLPGDVKPEITSSMIELSTGVCDDFAQALSQLREIRGALVDAAAKLDIGEAIELVPRCADPKNLFGALGIEAPAGAAREMSAPAAANLAHFG